jgi:hypothetical protein
VRSLPETREEPLSSREIVTAGFAVISFVVCSVVFGIRHSGFISPWRDVRCGQRVLATRLSSAVAS